MLPGTALNTATIARGQLLRRFPQYQAVNLFRPHIGYSTYHAAQFNLQKRFSDGLSALVNYTWSKQLDTSGVGNGASFLDPTTVEDISNYDDEYSYATYDVPHRMTANFVYELPLGRKKRFGKDWNGISQAVLGGWQISGSAVYQSGAPVALVANGFPGLGLGSIGNQVRRADIIAGANPQLSADTYRANARAGLAVFNRAAFAIPGDFFFGTAPRTLNGVRRDTYKNVDLTATKNFYFADGRNKLQLRAEFLNAFNITVFGTPATNINDPNFGTVTSQGNRPRIIQLVGRFTF